MKHFLEVSSKLTQLFGRGSNLKILTHFLKLPWQPEFLQNGIYFSNFKRGPHKNITIKFNGSLLRSSRGGAFEESFVDDDRKRVTPDTDWSQ